MDNGLTAVSANSPILVKAVSPIYSYWYLVHDVLRYFTGVV